MTTSPLPPPPFATPRLIATTSCLYVAAYLLTILVHETAHALVAWAVGGHPIEYHTWVDYTTGTLSVAARAAIALAGPLVSLAQGLLLFLYAWRTPRAGNGPFFGLYLSAFGFMNFLGYVVIAPVVPSGDSGQLVALWHVASWLQWSLALVAFGSLNYLIYQTGPLFLRQLPRAAQVVAPQRASGLRALLFWPWLVGSLLLVGLSVPSPLLALLYIPTVAMVLGRAYRAALRVPARGDSRSGRVQAHWLPVLAALLLAGLFRWLATGIAW